MMASTLDRVIFKTILLNYCFGEPWGTVGQGCQRIKMISKTYPRNTMQTTAVKSPPLRFYVDEEENKQHQMTNQF